MHSVRVYWKCYHPQNWAGRFIDWFTHGENTSHVSIIFPKMLNETSFVLWEVEADSKKGVIGHRHNVWDRDGEYRYVDLMEYEYRILGATALKLVGKKYDKPGIIGFVTRTRREDPARWFCSELVAHVLRKAGKPLSYKPSWKVTPTDCWASVAGTPCTPQSVVDTYLKGEFE